MGFWYDIYVASPFRERSCIDRFLNTYVNLEQERLRDDFVVSLLNLDFGLKTNTLEDSVQLGLLNDDCQYTLYFDSIGPDLKSSLVHYTGKGHLIFGLSIEVGAQRRKSRRKAKRLLKNLKREFNTTIGKVVFETAPSQMEDQFEEELALRGF